MCIMKIAELLICVVPFCICMASYRVWLDLLMMKMVIQWVGEKFWPGEFNLQVLMKGFELVFHLEWDMSVTEQYANELVTCKKRMIS